MHDVPVDGDLYDVRVYHEPARHEAHQVVVLRVASGLVLRRLPCLYGMTVQTCEMTAGALH